MDGVLLVVDVEGIVFRIHRSVQGPDMEACEADRQDERFGTGS
jgi:hypothetical protein